MPKALIYKAFGEVTVARDGLEPPQTAPKTVVLPLDDRAMLYKSGCENNQVLQKINSCVFFVYQTNIKGS